MATPTPTNPTQPSSASKKPTDHATTPSRLGHASPAPRSVPSPAATRKDQSGKTPISHATTSSKMLGGTPMMASLSQSGTTSTSSPGHAAIFETPSGLTGLGVDMGSGTPGQMSILSAAHMIPTMSELGLTASGGKRNEDEERRAKMRKILKRIGRRKGRVSRESITRLSRRVGFENSVDENLIVVAGNRVMIDVSFDKEAVQNVAVTVLENESSGKTLDDYQGAMGDVLLRELAAPDGMLLKTRLDRFAMNLNKLARMDQLSKQVNCFDATFGLYKNLKRLFELEEQTLKQQPETFHGSEKERLDWRIRHEVLCKGSGRPGLHAHGRVGLSLDYWTLGIDAVKEEHVDHPTSLTEAGHSRNTTDDVEDPHHTYTLLIETEECAADMYPSLRLSDNWLPEEFEIPAPDSGNSVPWLEPSPTYISENTGHLPDAMAIDGTQRLPDLRFIAKLSPPVIMPYQTAINVLSAVGASAPQIFIPLQYHSMLLDAATAKAERTISVLHDGKEGDVKHRYSLDVTKPEWGFKLEELPFSHPKQLIGLLPTLRQWAHVGELLRNAFCDISAPQNDTHLTNSITGASLNNGSASMLNGKGTVLGDLLGSTERQDSERTKSPECEEVSIGLTTSPQPVLAMSFSDSATDTVCTVTARFSTNADISVTSIDGFGESGTLDDKLSSPKAARFAKALSICGDLGVWVEWIKLHGREETT